MTKKEMTHSYITNLEPVFGVQEPLPLAGFPAGRARISMRRDSYATVFIKTENGIRAFTPCIHDGCWVCDPQLERQRNARVEHEAETGAAHNVLAAKQVMLDAMAEAAAEFTRKTGATVHEINGTYCTATGADGSIEAWVYAVQARTPHLPDEAWDMASALTGTSCVSRGDKASESTEEAE
jgi:hypothetical protein